MSKKTPRLAHHWTVVPGWSHSSSSHGLWLSWAAGAGPALGRLLWGCDDREVALLLGAPSSLAAAAPPERMPAATRCYFTLSHVSLGYLTTCRSLELTHSNSLELTLRTPLTRALT